MTSETHDADILTKNEKTCNILFWTAAILYGLTWSVVPYLLDNNLRADMIEMFFIGKEGVVSTYKHPALNSAILETCYQLSGCNFIVLPVLTQIFFFITAFAVWKLGKEFLSPFAALFGALVYYGYWGNFYKSLNYNHNIVLFAAWACVILFAFLALKYDRVRYWIALGVAIGIGTHFKYPILTLVASVLLFMAIDKSARKFWLRPGPYITTLLALAIALPQIVWIFQSDFSCLRFPLEYRGMEKTVINRFYAIWKGGISSVPLLVSSFVVLLSPLIGWKWRLRSQDKEQRFARNFLVFVIFGPFLIQLTTVFSNVISMDLGSYTQNYIFLGPFLLLLFRAEETPRNLRKAGYYFLITMFAYIIIFSAYCFYLKHHTSRIAVFTFPGRELAKQAEALWHEHYEHPLPYVTGPWWYGGNVAIYGKDRPSVHCESKPNNLDERFPLSNWSTDRHVQKYGGLILWEIQSPDEPTPEYFWIRYPSLIPLQPITLQPKNFKVKPIFIGVALVPPNPEIDAPPSQPIPWRYY